MLGWFKKKDKVAKKATEAMIEAIVTSDKPEPKKENKHIDCECAECIRRIKNAQ